MQRHMWARSELTEDARIGCHVIVACVIIRLQQKQSGDEETDRQQKSRSTEFVEEVRRRKCDKTVVVSLFLIAGCEHLSCCSSIPVREESRFQSLNLIRGCVTTFGFSDILSPITTDATEFTDIRTLNVRFYNVPVFFYLRFIKPETQHRESVFILPIAALDQGTIEILRNHHQHFVREFGGFSNHALRLRVPPALQTSLYTNTQDISAVRTPTPALLLS
ncbi:Hypothetical predicted protein [Scomber scombrus]|uniref:Uncharacterized protein n=1 Tax=Scomber scombrus TaxID=13677 RepID=A0AAV1NY34_SCOSC